MAETTTYAPGVPCWVDLGSPDIDASVAFYGGLLELGRMALFTDPTGAFLGIWQARDFAGAAAVNEPGSLSWNELDTRDPEAAKTFYSAVFGWEGRESDGEVPYTQWFLPGREDPVGGMLDMRGRVPDEVPPHWNVYFAVADTDAAVSKAQELGGGVAMPPMDVPVGRFALLSDPSGAHFSVIRLNR